MFASNTSHSGEQLDAQFNYVTMLLPGNGTNGAQNNTFLDASTNNFTITRNGNATQGTFSPYGDLWSNYFDGTGDYLTAPDNAAWDVGSSNWTAEAWVFPTASPNQPIIIGQWTSSYAWAMQLSDNSSRNLRGLVYNGSFTDFSGSTPLTLNAWNHCVFTRDGTTLRLYLNGVQVATNSFGSGSINTSSSVLSIGADGAGSQPFQGYLSNVRFVNGTCLYPNGTTFTPPTSPLTAVTNTKLLTCQSNRFIDNSSNNFTITRNGDVSVQRFSPFSPTAAYSAATVGGSGYFDTAGDYLVSNSANLAVTTQDFCAEAWIYVESYAASSGEQGIFFLQNQSQSNAAGGTWNLLFSNTGSLTAGFHAGSTRYTVTSSTALRLKEWTHVAIIRNGTTYSVSVNGVLTSSNLGSLTLNGHQYFYCANGLGDNNPQYQMNGYVASARYVRGSAVYTSNFTPPTGPLTAISGTAWLCNFTNAGIIDNAMMNDLETVGNAQISTSVKKYGTGSLAFDGTGDGLTLNAGGQNFAFGTGDFTIEMWVYPSTSSQSGIIYDSRPTSTSGLYPTIRLDSGTLKFYTSGASQITGGTLSANTWYHIAVCRSGTSTRLFIDGAQSGSTYTDSNSYINGAVRPLIGADGFDNYTGSNYFNGYIDDLRITKGYARYTANFTPPAAAFPTN